MLNFIRKYFEKYKELILYAAFGAGTTIVNVGTLYILSALFGEENYLWLNIIAWFLSVLFAFVTNKLWVFESKQTDLATCVREGTEFFGARAASLLFEEVFLYITVDMLTLSMWWMKIVATVIVIIANYVLSKLFIFRK